MKTDDFTAQLTQSLVDLIIPALIFLASLIVLYTILLVIKAKFLDKTEQKNSKLIAGSFSSTLIMLIEKLPSLLILLAAFIGLGLIKNIGTSFVKIYENQQRIKELSVFVQNLSSNDKLVQVTVGKKTRDSSGEEARNYRLNVYDSITGEVISESEFNEKNLRIDFMVINFDYSEIKAGNHKNIAYPYRVFSDRIPPENARILETLFTAENPEPIIDSESEKMYGLSRESFTERAKEFLEIINDPEKSREAGIRSFYGNTITIPAGAQEGSRYAVCIEGSGGLSLKKLLY